jgi:hypothetical protein
MPSDPQVTPEQLAQEHSIRFAILADLGVLALALPVGLLGGSLTIKAEAIRFVLGMSIFAYTVMRLHRGKLQDLFGGGKSSRRQSGHRSRHAWRRGLDRHQGDGDRQRTW